MQNPPPMARQHYATSPDPKYTGWPQGVRYIIGNEGCERFSYYGMRSILQVHITSLYVVQALQQDIAESQAQEMVHLFFAGVYAFPMIGAIISDRLLGKYRTILSLSLVYCLGHLVLSVAENRIGGMWVGLALIAIGSGGIKPCVSAHVGDQFGTGNWHLVGKIFQAFYFSINLGSFAATLAIPHIRAWEQDHFHRTLEIGGHEFTTSLAFGLPGILMFVATVVFWMGRTVFIHVPPKPGGTLGLLDVISSSLLFVGLIALPLFFWGELGQRVYWCATIFCVMGGGVVFHLRQKIEQDEGLLAVLIYAFITLVRGGATSARRAVGPSVPADSIQRHWLFAGAAKRFGDLAAEGPASVLRILGVFILVSVFWALFDQHASSWIRQSQRMELRVDLMFMQLKLLPSQIPALNPLMVMALIPLNNYCVYPFINRKLFPLTPLRKMTIGMFVASAAFSVVALLQMSIDAAATDGNKVSVIWHFFPYLIMTQSEVMVSITGLEFAYTQAPPRMKSTIMGFWMLTIALGNKLVAVITKIPDMGLVEFFWLFAGMMALAALAFGLRAAFCPYKDYTQNDSL